jgi:flagellar biosynthesis protein FliQ
MSMLSFMVILVSLVFNTVIALVLCLAEFSKCSLSFFLKVIMFSKNSFKILLCCDFLCYMCSFICLEEV